MGSLGFQLHHLAAPAANSIIRSNLACRRRFDERRRRRRGRRGRREERSSTSAFAIITYQQQLAARGRTCSAGYLLAKLCYCLHSRTGTISQLGCRRHARTFIASQHVMTRGRQVAAHFQN